MSPQIIPHFSATSSGGLTWDANMIAKNPYVIGLEGCIFRRVVDTIADLANISNPQLNDRALVWGADSTETKIYMWDGSTWGDMGQPLSNVQYVDSYSKESMFFYKIEPDTEHYYYPGNVGTGLKQLSLLGLISNCYVIGSVSAYEIGSGIGGYLAWTQCTSDSISSSELTQTPTEFNIPIKCNGMTLFYVGNSPYVGFKAASN